MRWNPPARDHNSRPASVRLVPTPSAHDRIDTRKNAAKGSAHIVVGNAHRKKPHSISRNATALAARTHISFLRLTIRPSSNAHFLTAAAMSVLALLSFWPDLTAFLASNTDPGFITLSADPTATLTGSMSAQAPAAPVPRMFHCLSLTCLKSISLRSAR